MTPLLVGYIGVAALVILLFTGLHIGVIMAAIGFIGMVYISGLDAGLGVLKTVPYSTFASYDLSVVPLFILMGAFCGIAGMSKDLYDTAHKWIGHFPGGLAMATVGACAGFAAVCGSSIATAVTMGTVALPEMRRYKYDPGMATGVIAAGGTIGILIPPSITMIVYCIITEQSIGKLFMAGFIPGILQAVFYMATIYILCKLNPSKGPPGPSTSLREKIFALKNSWIVFLLFVIVIGGIYLGVFSPTEAAGVGACGAFFFALARKQLGWRGLQSSLLETIQTTAMVFVILMGAMILGYFLAATKLPFEVASLVGSMPMDRYVILLFIVVIYLFLGCIMDSMAMILLTVPIFFPVIMKLGFDPIWFGIIIVRVVEIGLITPPVGLNVFVISGIAKDVPMYTIFRGIAPFLLADLCHMLLLIFVPQISLFLPSLMK